MTQPINYPNQQNPGYSGITINITNPVLNPPSHNQHCCNQVGYNTNPQQQIALDRNIYPQTIPSNTYAIPEYSYYENNKAESEKQGITDKINNNQEEQDKVQNEALKVATSEKTAIENQKGADVAQNTNIPNNYPPQYYINNHNYIQNEKERQTGANSVSHEQVVPTVAPTGEQTKEKVEEDLSSSKEIINNLDTRAAEEKQKENNSKKVRVVALTNEYIMSLENYLNNPNKEIRLMASKEILTRLDEDKERYDDAALNALLNKMLQDPEKLVRIAALSALASQLASGNEYTVELLKNIQNNPNADKEDVVQAANILLKMSASTELKYVPVKEKSSKSASDKDLEAAQKKMEQLQAQLQKYKEKEVAQILQSQQV
ncbi:MAG: HEAT repeat domain-containing protein [Cyanobacteria bacterium SIG31]|nr:HEAT repeat domain-containing protein [Cyanobacteria bacterium SIG31]